ncbi:DUF1203 domain-containing protein [Pelomonas sp. V22]|uniref:DUF1203 domain-containing protein n=1 Tax=Pelomonas sp. V22 TaxID=2822139 RepID=UPI0024A9CC08|nr:DUF1203 domain-containing protein [Pelomonas sp. V22]MDI4634966.1 DUF1203 domain-containing protein [Pelomonas sp. V22]
MASEGEEVSPLTGDSMDKLAVWGIASDFVNLIRQDGADAHGQPALRTRAEGQGNPCRHCLQLIAEGEEMRVLAYRPFDTVQPYAEVSPIFLHQQDCPHYASDRLPAWFAFLQPALVRGYDRSDWIRYETGKVVAGTELEAECERILDDPDVAYVHIRSKFNCFQCRVERA